MAVVISRIGVSSAWGRGIDSFREGWNSGRVALQESEELQYLPSSLAGLAPNKGFRQYLKKRKAAKLMTDSARLALDSCGQVLENLQTEKEDIGLFFAVGREPSDEGEAEAALIACIEDGRFDERRMVEEGIRLYPPLLPLKTLPNLILGHLSIHFGLQGENAAWAGEGIQSLIEGYWAIEEGRAEKVIVGASDSLVDLGQARDLKRLGIVDAPGEAAVAFLLEKDVNGQSGLGRVSLNDSGQNVASDDIELIQQIGYCGVVNTQLNILKSLLKGERFQASDVTIESRLRAEI